MTTSGLSKSTSGRGLVGLLLVALPVSLVAWLVIWPIISAIVRTVWRSSPEGVAGFDLSSYIFFFSDAYSLNNLSLTLWTTAVCALLLLVVSLPIALYLRFAKGRSHPMCRRSRSCRCSFHRSSLPMP